MISLLLFHNSNSVFVPVKERVPVDSLFLGSLLQTVGGAILVVDVLALSGVAQPIAGLLEGAVVT
jgi:hypothetical protein